MSDPVTPAMGLVQPVVLGTPGPDYAVEINGNSDLIDQHDHSSGKGVPVTPAGLSINADLSFQGHAALSQQQTGYVDQGAPLSGSLLDRVYFSGGELFANDGSGNQVQITLGGAVNTGSTGNITGLTSPASASYSSVTKVFTWAQAANQTAHMSFASAILHRGAATSENGITLTPPSSVPSAYTITLPSAPPGSTLPLQMDSSGAVSAAQIPTAGIANGAVTSAKLASSNTATAAINTTGNTATVLTDVPGASVSLTTADRPVAIGLRGAAADTNNFISLFLPSAGTALVSLAILVDGVNVAEYTLSQTFSISSQFVQSNPIPCVVIPCSAGTHTIKLQYKMSGTASGSVGFTTLVWYATEL